MSGSAGGSSLGETFLRNGGWFGGMNGGGGFGGVQTIGGLTYSYSMFGGIPGTIPPNATVVGGMSGGLGGGLQAGMNGMSGGTGAGTSMPMNISLRPLQSSLKQPACVNGTRPSGPFPPWGYGPFQSDEPYHGMFRPVWPWGLPPSGGQYGLLQSSGSGASAIGLQGGIGQQFTNPMGGIAGMNGGVFHGGPFNGGPGSGQSYTNPLGGVLNSGPSNGGPGSCRSQDARSYAPPYQRDPYQANPYGRLQNPYSNLGPSTAATTQGASQASRSIPLPVRDASSGQFDIRSRPAGINASGLSGVKAGTGSAGGSSRLDGSGKSNPRAAAWGHNSGPPSGVLWRTSPALQKWPTTKTPAAPTGTPKYKLNPMTGRHEHTGPNR
jgi:hypothetical protein